MSKTDNNMKVYVNADGERVMRITEVIRVLAKDQLVLWANMLGFKHIDYRKELDRTANIGSMAHGFIEDFTNPRVLAKIDYEKYDIYRYGDRVEAQNAIESFRQWCIANRDIYKVKFRERVVVGKHVGGTIDAGIQGLKDPTKITLMDYKTSSGFYLTMYLQLAGYVQIYEEVYGPNTIDGVAILRLDKKNGDIAQCRFIDRANLDPFITCFNCLLSVAQSTKMLESTYWNLTEMI